MVRCARCGRPGRTLRLELRGVPFARFRSCDRCTAALSTQLQVLRALLLAMREAGVERDQISDVLPLVLDKMPLPLSNETP